MLERSSLVFRKDIEQLLQDKLDDINLPLVLHPVIITEHSDDEWEARSNGNSDKDFIAVRINPKTKEVLGTRWLLALPNSRDDAPSLISHFRDSVLKFFGMNGDHFSPPGQSNSK